MGLAMWATPVALVALLWLPQLRRDHGIGQAQVKPVGWALDAPC